MSAAGLLGTVGSGVLAGAAANALVLMVARHGTGLAFALLLGLSLAIINVVFPPERRSSAISLHLGASFGIAACPEHGRDASDLLRHAQLALDLARRSGTDVGVYDAELDREPQGRLWIIEELRRGIDDLSERQPDAAPDRSRARLRR